MFCRKRNIVTIIIIYTKTFFDNTRVQTLIDRSWSVLDIHWQQTDDSRDFTPADLIDIASGWYQ